MAKKDRQRLPIALNQVVVTDLSDVHILPRDIFAGKITINYEDGAYLLSREDGTFQVGDQEVLLATWSDDQKMIDSDKYIQDHMGILECRLRGWRLTDIREIKTRLIPILKQRSDGA